MYFLSFFEFVLCAVLWRYWYSKRGTPLRPPRSILLRSPQLPWALLGLNLVGLLIEAFYSVNLVFFVGHALMSVYYALRFGALRLPTSLFYLLICFLAVYLNQETVLDIIGSSFFAIGTAFSTDMIWNWLLKRKGIIVPGTSEELPTP